MSEFIELRDIQRNVYFSIEASLRYVSIASYNHYSRRKKNDHHELLFIEEAIYYSSLLYR